MDIDLGKEMTMDKNMFVTNNFLKIPFSSKLNEDLKSILSRKYQFIDSDISYKKYELFY